MTKVTMKSQSGAVLIISLIMLLALTIIGITSSSVTGIEEKMAANAKDVNLAFQAAEAALREVETNVLTSKPVFDHTAIAANQGVNGIYTMLFKNPACTSTTSGQVPWILRSSTTTPPSDTTKEPFYANIDWESTSNPLKYVIYNNVSANGTRLTGLYKPPVYIIEEIYSELPSSSCGSDSLEGGQTCQGSFLVKVWMRITAHGWGSNPNSVATVQSVVKATYSLTAACPS